MLCLLFVFIGIDAQLTWLTTHLGYSEEVEEKWEATRRYRLDILNIKDGTLSDYLDRFKLLRQPDGFMLVRVI